MLLDSKDDIRKNFDALTKDNPTVREAMLLNRLGGFSEVDALKYAVIILAEQAKVVRVVHVHHDQSSEPARREDVNVLTQSYR